MHTTGSKKIIIAIISVIAIIISGGYIYTRYFLLKAKDFKPDYSKSKSVTDLRPAIIAKLQQLLKDGSGGLYHLSIEKIEPDLAAFKISISNANLSVDSAVWQQLKAAHSLPDHTITASFSILHINGIRIQDMLSMNHISVGGIQVISPVIDVYNNNSKSNDKSSSLIYKSLLERIKSISIDSISVQDGTVRDHSSAKKAQANRLQDISVNMLNVLIDSSAVSDTKRFLFSKDVELTAKNFHERTADSLYTLSCKAINFSSANNQLIASGIELQPRGNKQWFETYLHERKEMYTLTLPKLTLAGISWKDALRSQSLVADEAVIQDAKCAVYLDRSLPFRKVKMNNFPHQILMRLPVQVSIAAVRICHAGLTYSEHNPGMDRTGTIYIDDINGEASNITNMSSLVRKHKMMILHSTGLFMHTIPVTTSFHFDLSKFKTGNFTMDLAIKNIDSAILNPITAPLGEFELKKGTIKKGIAHVIGNNVKATGHGELLYNDLYLVGLKKNTDDPGQIKKKGLISFLGNVFLIKNNNPSKGRKARVVAFNFTRQSKTTFFSLIWETIFLGILKTIGLPASFAHKSY